MLQVGQAAVELRMPYCCRKEMASEMVNILGHRENTLNTDLYMASENNKGQLLTKITLIISDYSRIFQVISGYFRLYKLISAHYRLVQTIQANFSLFKHIPAYSIQSFSTLFRRIPANSNQC